MYMLPTLLYFICIHAFAQTPGVQSGRVYISKDQGVNWERADKGFPVDDAINAWVVQDKSVIAGTNAHGVFISSDGLKTWNESGRGLLRKTRIISMASYKNILLAGTYRDGIFLSDDGGASWRLSNEGLKNHTVRCFYAPGFVLLAGTDDGIYSSADDGKSWTLEISGLQINTFSAIGNQILAATNQGVLASEDLGKTWDPIFEEGAIYTLAANKNETYLLDFFGNVYKSSTRDFIWLKAETYLPFHYTFQLTPLSNKFLTIAWTGSFKNLDAMTGSFRSNGLPENSAFTELLDTPFGLLAGAVLPENIE